MASPHVAATAALIIASGVLGRASDAGADRRATARDRAQLGGGGDEAAVRRGARQRRGCHSTRRTGSDTHGLARPPASPGRGALGNRTGRPAGRPLSVGLGSRGTMRVVRDRVEATDGKTKPGLI